MRTSAEKHQGEQARGVRMLHLLLLGSGVVVALAFHFMTRLRGPILTPDSATPVIAYAFAGIGLTIVAFAVLLIRPRVPARPSSQGLNEFWGTAAVRGKALLLWVLCENGAIISGTGYLLTGHLATLVSMAIGLVALAWYGPARLAGET
jgi:hypothetical protein